MCPCWSFHPYASVCVCPIFTKENTLYACSELLSLNTASWGNFSYTWVVLLHSFTSCVVLSLNSQSPGHGILVSSTFTVIVYVVTLISFVFLNHLREHKFLKEKFCGLMIRVFKFLRFNASYNEIYTILPSISSVWECLPCFPSFKCCVSLNFNLGQTDWWKATPNLNFSNYEWDCLPIYY